MCESAVLTAHLRFGHSAQSCIDERLHLVHSTPPPDAIDECRKTIHHQLVNLSATADELSLITDDVCTHYIILHRQHAVTELYRHYSYLMWINCGITYDSRLFWWLVQSVPNARQQQTFSSAMKAATTTTTSPTTSTLTTTFNKSNMELTDKKKTNVRKGMIFTYHLLRDDNTIRLIQFFDLINKGTFHWSAILRIPFKYLNNIIHLDNFLRIASQSPISISHRNVMELMEWTVDKKCNRQENTTTLLLDKTVEPYHLNNNNVKAFAISIAPSSVDFTSLNTKHLQQHSIVTSEDLRYTNNSNNDNVPLYTVKSNETALYQSAPITADSQHSNGRQMAVGSDSGLRLLPEDDSYTFMPGRSLDIEFASFRHYMDNVPVPTNEVADQRVSISLSDIHGHVYDEIFRSSMSAHIGSVENKDAAIEAVVNMELVKDRDNSNDEEIAPRRMPTDSMRVSQISSTDDLAPTSDGGTGGAEINSLYNFYKAYVQEIENVKALRGIGAGRFKITPADVVPLEMNDSYGELRQDQLDQVLHYMMHSELVAPELRLNDFSTFVDAGSGSGKCLIHAHLRSKASCVGIEYDADYYNISLRALNDFVQNNQSVDKSKLILMKGNIINVLPSSLKSCSHIYWYGWAHKGNKDDKKKVESSRRILEAILQCDFKLLVCYHEPAALKRSGANCLRLVHQLPCRTTGSQTFNAYFYVKVATETVPQSVTATKMRPKSKRGRKRKRDGAYRAPKQSKKSRVETESDDSESSEDDDNNSIADETSNDDEAVDDEQSDHAEENEDEDDDREYAAVSNIDIGAQSGFRHLLRLYRQSPAIRSITTINNRNDRARASISTISDVNEIVDSLKGNDAREILRSILLHRTLGLSVPDGFELNHGNNPFHC